MLAIVALHRNKAVLSKPQLTQVHVMTEQSVEELLAEAAQASADKPKKERVKKADGEVPAGASEPKAKKERKPKEPKAPKLDADGNPIVKDPAARVSLVVNGEAVTMRSVADKAQLTVVGNIGSREGSKRAERAKAFEGSATVAEFLGKGGASKDLLRHLKSGAVEVHVDGHKVEVA